MVTEEILKLHDELERKAQARPWSSEMKEIPGYGPLLFWTRKPGRRILWDDENDARYLAFVRNMAPEFVREIRELRARYKSLSEKHAELLELLEP